uniref:Uncharacterized protein n=1 Tax=Plectus sambesii TaxID=2011161 RepID=A0A914W0P4_9BILA
MAMCEPFPEGLFEEQEALRMPARRRDSSEFVDDEDTQNFQRQHGVRRRSTASSGKGSALHSAAEKLKEAKQKLKEKLSGEHHERVITDEELAKAAKKRDELKEKEKVAERRASDAAEKYDLLVQKHMLKKCHEADQQANVMNDGLYSNAVNNFNVARVAESH